MVEIPFPSQAEQENDKSVSRPQSKRFSLPALRPPLFKTTRFNETRASTSLDAETAQQKTMTKDRKSSKKKGHVTFSPSTEEKDGVHDKRDEGARHLYNFRRLSLRGPRKESDAKTRFRRNSHDGSIGRAQAKHLAQSPAEGHKRLRSISFSKKGIQISDTSDLAASGKGRLAQAKLSRRKALAARHARVLERIINAGTSIELEELKAKRLQKLGPQANERTKVQLYPVVSPKKIKALKVALSSQSSANEVIDELRFMQIDRTTTAAVVLNGAGPLQDSKAESALHHLVEGKERRSHPSAPIRAVCLDCTDEEAARRSDALPAKSADPTSQPTGVQSVLNVATSPGVLGAVMNRVSIWWQPSTEPKSGRGGAISDTLEYAYEVEEDIRLGDVKEALADTTRLSTAAMAVAQPTIGAIATQVETIVLPENKVPGKNSTKVVSVTSVTSADKAVDALSAISPISLITAPRTTLASFGAQQSGAIDALATLSGAAVTTVRGGKEAMLEVRPPTDRMSIFIYWWGFEITLPEPSMSYLGTAHSVSGAFMGFLQTMVTTGGVPELLPFIRYISSFMEMEFSAIKSQDRNRQGVVIAATWLMPLALVPRPWDYGGYDDTKKQKPAPIVQPADATPALLPIRLASVA